jgi:hypothetical protein
LKNSAHDQCTAASHFFAHPFWWSFDELILPATCECRVKKPRIALGGNPSTPLVTSSGRRYQPRPGRDRL